MSNNILIVNLGGLGDILNSTPIAKHYKIENKNNRICFLTRDRYKFAILNNEYIDEIYTVENKMLNNVSLTHSSKKTINDQFEKTHKIIYSAPYMSPKYDGSPRSTLLKVSKYECSGISEWNCDYVPNIALSDSEIEEAKTFFKQLNGTKKILLEYENFSAQSPYNEQYFEELCQKLNNKNYDLILTGLKIPQYLLDAKSKYNINFYHYNGSFMSNAELYNLIDIFIGCCSGITCLTSSEYCVNNKIRIEICKGEHWSSIDWTHNSTNKHICYSFEQFKDVLKVI